jgi:predicted protein tyrosine phosphatase
MRIHVCSLSKLPATVAATGARHVVTLINVATPVPRPPQIAEPDHLYLGMNDIIANPEPGQVLPAEDHIETLLRFAGAWHAEHRSISPLVIHCYAGVSRSTAAAFITACALDPSRDERALAALLRQRSPTATPNRRLVELADARLKRDGRMLAAIDAIGRGADCFEGVPFALEV